MIGDQDQMKIGIDARFLTHPQLGGFKTYSVNLVKAMSQVDNHNLYVIYVDRQPSKEMEFKSDNFTYKVVSGTMPVIGMPIREQITLRRQIALDKLDIIHFLCNTAPINLSDKFVLSLLDVIQVKSPQNFPNVRGRAQFKQWAINTYSKWTILNSVKFARRVITLSNYEKEQIVKYLGINSQRVVATHIAPNPVYYPADDETRENWRSEMRQKLDLPRRFILGVGYEPRKNIPLLIKAFSQIVPRNPGLDLVVVAAQEDRRIYFQQLSTQMGIDNRVCILGALQPSDLAVLYNLAELFVFPSERESFGLPPLEAIACGVPTIAMNMTSLPEVLEDGALLIDGKDVQTWAIAIERVLRDENHRSDLIMKGIQQAAKPTWQRCARETIEVYQAVGEEN